jgi:hypothetical protein
MADRQRLLELALKGLEAERAQIEHEITILQHERSGNRATQTGKRTLSPEARQRISEGMKRKHAERRVQATKGRRRGMTAAGRKKLSNMMKARWVAKRRAAKKA